MRIARSIAIAFAAFLSVPGFAAPKTVTLSVPDMTCATCPITVRKALSRVPGVSRVDARLETKQAVVTFDDEKTSVEALTAATANAGYPSTVKQ